MDGTLSDVNQQSSRDCNEQPPWKGLGGLLTLMRSNWSKNAEARLPASDSATHLQITAYPTRPWRDLLVSASSRLSRLPRGPRDTGRDVSPSAAGARYAAPGRCRLQRRHGLHPSQPHARGTGAGLVPAAAHRRRRRRGSAIPSRCSPRPRVWPAAWPAARRRSTWATTPTPPVSRDRRSSGPRPS